MKFSTKLKLTSAASLLSLVPLAARAEDYNYDYSTTDAAAGTAAAGIIGGLLIFWLIFLVIGLAFLIFWLIMLIDAFKRQNWQDDNQKNLWLIILIVSIFIGLAWLAAILYYFIIKKPLDSGKASPMGSPTSGTVQKPTEVKPEEKQ